RGVGREESGFDFSGPQRYPGRNLYLARLAPELSRRRLDGDSGPERVWRALSLRGRVRGFHLVLLRVFAEVEWRTQPASVADDRAHADLRAVAPARETMPLLHARSAPQSPDHRRLPERTEEAEAQTLDLSDCLGDGFGK